MSNSPFDFLKDTLEQAKPQAGLCLVATPLGNKGDITLRALHILASVDRILCEDTRVSGSFLRAYGIKTPLQSYHDHNATKVRPRIVSLLSQGETMALISDAGTPLIADPGYKLVQACYDHGIPITAIPGPCAPIMALTVSGLPTDRFYFCGFVPCKHSERQAFYTRHQGFPCTLIMLETAGRLMASLKDLETCLGNRFMAVTRELTKKFEEVRRGPVQDLLCFYQENGPPKGEVVLVIQGQSLVSESSEQDVALALKALKDRSYSLRQAVEEVSSHMAVPRKQVYVLALKIFASSED